MKLIMLINDRINDEIEDAAFYAEKAIEYANQNKETAEMFFKLSEDEMNHANSLHETVVKLIEQHRTKNGEPPKEMLAIYNYEHGKAIQHMAHVKNLRSMYKK